MPGPDEIPSGAAPVPGAGLEVALEALDRDVGATLRALAAAIREAKRLQAAAAHGVMRDVAAATEGLARLTDAAATAASELRAAWTFDVAGHFESGGYAKELLAAATDAGVRAVESDEKILCYPSIVSVSTSDASVVIDKRRERRVRPSVVVAALARGAERPPRFRPEAFLETLAAAYDLVAPRPGATVRLLDVYRVLTLRPGSGRDYTRPEFARDLYLLDQSGATATRSGRILSLPASALTRSGGTLTTVTRTGQVKVYAGIAFGEPSPGAVPDPLSGGDSGAAS